MLQVLGLDLAQSGLFSVLPWMTMAVTANFAGWLADTLVDRGVDVTTVRKVSYGHSQPPHLRMHASHHARLPTFLPKPCTSVIALLLKLVGAAGGGGRRGPRGSPLHCTAHLLWLLALPDQRCPCPPPACVRARR